MKKSVKVLMLALAMVLLAGTAAADTVEYTTFGTLDCNGALNCAPLVPGSSITVGTATNGVNITFFGSGGIVDAPTNGSFGIFQVSTYGSGLTAASGGIQGGPVLFTLTIIQTIPTLGDGTLSAVINASVLIIGQTDGTVTFSLAGSTTTINGVVYSVFNMNNALVPPATLFGITSLEGRIDDTAVPEPASLLLLGSGLMGAGSYVRRKFLQ